VNANSPNSCRYGNCFRKVDIGDLPAEFLTIIHLSSSKNTGFQVSLLDVNLYLSTLQSVWLFY
jgi:hypothetical protein